mgnify:CR=1 FL=1
MNDVKKNNCFKKGIIDLKNVKVKAAGGISSFDDAEKFISLGADRLGTSRIVKIVKAMEKGEEHDKKDTSY